MLNPEIIDKQHNFALLVSFDWTTPAAIAVAVSSFAIGVLVTAFWRSVKK